MTKRTAKETVDRTEAVAAIGRAIRLLETLKGQLRAKALDGQTLDDLINSAKRELQPTAEQIAQLRQDQFDEFMLTYRRNLGQEA